LLKPAQASFEFSLLGHFLWGLRRISTKTENQPRQVYMAGFETWQNSIEPVIPSSFKKLAKSIQI
jgi:hypothetical protein